MKTKFNEGDRVTVTKPINGYRAYGVVAGSGEIGQIVAKDASGLPVYGVHMDDKYHPTNKWGMFWIREEKLELENKGGNYMLKGYKAVKVNFINTDRVKTQDNDKTYNYAGYGSIMAGDVVLVEGRAAGEYTLAEVQEVTSDLTEVQKCTKQVICIINLSSYSARKDKAQRVEELKEAMQYEVKNAQEIVLLESLAEHNPNMKKLLDEYKELTGDKE